MPHQRLLRLLLPRCNKGSTQELLLTYKIKRVMKKMFIVAAMFVAASMVACCGEQNAKDGEKACCEQKAECKDECKGECEKAEECTKECTEECCDSTKCAGCDSTCVDCNKAE